MSDCAYPCVCVHVGVRVCPCLCFSVSVYVCVVRMTAKLLVTVFPARKTLRSSSLNEIAQLSSKREREGERGRERWKERDGYNVNIRTTWGLVSLSLLRDSQSAAYKSSLL